MPATVPHSSLVAEVTTAGSTIRSTAAARRTEIETRRTSSAALAVGLPRPNVKIARGRTRRKEVAGSRRAQWTAVAQVAGNSPAPAIVQLAAPAVAVIASAIKEYHRARAVPGTADSVVLRADRKVARRGLAASGAPPAWAVPAVAVDEVVAVGGGGKRAMKKGQSMKEIRLSSRATYLFALLLFLGFSGSVAAFMHASPQANKKTAEASQPAQETFSTPKEAADAPKKHLLPTGLCVEKPLSISLNDGDGQWPVIIANDKNGAIRFFRV